MSVIYLRGTLPRRADVEQAEYGAADGTGAAAAQPLAGRAGRARRPPARHARAAPQHPATCRTLWCPLETKQSGEYIWLTNIHGTSLDILSQVDTYHSIIIVYVVGYNGQ